jgi:hypothetical protein
MDALELIRWGAAILVIAASIMVAWGDPPRLVAWGFVTFCAASVTWIGAAVYEAKWALMTQNLVLLVVNIWGVRRWFRRAAHVAEDAPAKSTLGQPAE